MRELGLAGVDGVRCEPDVATGTGVLVLAGSSGRVDRARARLLAEQGAIAESIRWFGGPGQHDGPWEVPLELFLGHVEHLGRDCDRVVVVGTSFGAEAALLTGSLSEDVAAVVAFAPSDVVWAGVTHDGRVTSHWTLEGIPLPFVPFDDTWEPATEPPAYDGLYRASRRRFAGDLDAATIPVERIRDLVLVAGGDDRVWPAAEHAERIRHRRAARGLLTTVVTDPAAGHRTILPGEPVVTGGQPMARGGSEDADRRLGSAAWPALLRVLRGRRHDDVTTAELVGGVEHRELVIAPYDAAWPAIYATHRARIHEAAAVISIEHIGSTSVPGLAAKPIVDVLVTVSDITDEDAYLAPLLAAGYELRVREPGHRMVRTPERDVHVHVLEDGDPEAGEYLLLRDRLRSDDADRELYESTKRRLAQQDWPDMNAYADAKTQVIEEIKQRARAADLTG
ncbi:GrpB family protein [Nocardioides maradonensis]